ncbi:hypothetical protein K488DRAFT_69881 [Vararia minispora EC-137]|uniref:Uncharacterized protein n=1 Tax=Vararia minispora EC-137 TaxID=1314806 RepID=A0ACB8QPC4_9AGAM|nr:hypothetical protein K488DRAFT_69881 [Vararia minispora EC-137]
MATPPSVVICGGGIVGLSTAFYLSALEPAATIHVLDTSPTLFACASGRAAGFLASDWFPSSTASLGALSFRLHASLARAHAGRATWGYAPSLAYSLASASAVPSSARGEDWLFDHSSRARMARAPAPPARLPAWLAPARAETISSAESTAQVQVPRATTPRARR